MCYESTDINCPSKYQVTRKPDYFVVNFNNKEHSEGCKEILSNNVKLKEMLSAGAKPKNIVKTLNLGEDQKIIKGL